MSKNRVATVLTALDTLQQTIPHLTDGEREELAEHLQTIAGAFEASAAAEDVKVPFVKEISLGLADVAGMVRDAYGLATQQS